MKPMGKILIIDDDPSFLKLYEDRLGEEGYFIVLPLIAAKLSRITWGDNSPRLF